MYHSQDGVQHLEAGSLVPVGLAIDTEVEWSTEYGLAYTVWQAGSLVPVGLAIDTEVEWSTESGILSR